jgi:hypothetical protein
MFPGLFANSLPAPSPLWDTLDWFNPFWTDAEVFAEFHPDNHHLSPSP